ncbi:MAG: protein translocase subunit SecD [Pseudobdellovibrionaceae bacterium]
MDSLRWRTWIAAFGVALALVWVAPNVISTDKIWWPSKQKLNYGLDIQGGLHLVLGVDVNSVVSESVQRLVISLKSELSKENIPYKDIRAGNAALGEVILEWGTEADAKSKLEKYFSEQYSTTLQQISSTANTANYRYFDAYLIDYKSRVIQQAIETIRNRVDQFGVAEPSISQQGADRILVQLPGMADAEKAKQLINTTAKLDFMLVSREKTTEELRVLITAAEKAGNYSLATLKYPEYVKKINQDLLGKLPEKTVVYFERSENATKIEAASIPLLLRTDTDLGGDALDDAGVNFGQYGEPEVSLKFNAAGAVKFADLTGSSVGQQMAVVLDKVVKSAPNIKDRISGGNAVITLGGGTRDRDQSLNEAKMISTALRAGALPVSLEQLEERRVGPSLGSDSIAKAKLGSYIGALLIVIFMVVYYRAMGVIATLSLSLNILCIFALLTSLGATLTLPGISGIALTVGFAVDANVLIHERIKEELRSGGSWKIAIQEGYSRAMSAILDANATTGATAVVLLYFGTGPVKGFAVTLLMGIFTTLFANVFVSKVIVDLLMNRWNVKKLSV